MWGAAAIPGTPPTGTGFTFASPIPAIGTPVPSLGPVAPVIPATTPAPIPAAGVGAAPAATAPAPVIPGNPSAGGGPVRNALSRVRERVSTPGSRGHSFVTDFAAGVSQPNEGRPLAAFLQGFAGAIGSSRGRQAAQAEAAAAAEERDYQRGRDARDDARADRGEDRADRTLTLAERRAETDAKLERDRIAAENERNRLLNAKTAAEIAEIERAATTYLTPDDLNDIETQTNDYIAAQTKLAQGNAFVELDETEIDAINADAAQYRADLTEQYLLANGFTPEDYAAARGRTGTAAAAPAAAVDLTPLPRISGMDGVGTETQPYTGSTVNAAEIRRLAEANKGREIFFVDPATGTVMSVRIQP